MIPAFAGSSLFIKGRCFQGKKISAQIRRDPTPLQALVLWNKTQKNHKAKGKPSNKKLGPLPRISFQLFWCQNVCESLIRESYSLSRCQAVCQNRKQSGEELSLFLGPTQELHVPISPPLFSLHKHIERNSSGSFKGVNEIESKDEAGTW